MDEIRNSKEELEMTDAMLRQQDLIDNASYDVCCSYLGIPDKERENLFPWNMQILAQVREGITDALLQFGKPVCYPYIEHDEARSRYCNQKNCYCENCIRDSESIQILSYNFYEFEDYPLYFIKMRLDKDERVRLLQQFDLWYAGTDQETKQYALEFAVIVRMLLDDAVVLNPKYLALGEVLDEMLSLIPDSKRKLYREHLLKIQDGYYEEKDGGQMDYSSEKTHYRNLEDAIPDIIMFALSICRENIPQYYIYNKILYVPLLQWISLEYIRKNPKFVQSVLDNAVSTYHTGYTKEIRRKKKEF